MTHSFVPRSLGLILSTILGGCFDPSEVEDADPDADTGATSDTAATGSEGAEGSTGGHDSEAGEADAGGSTGAGSTDDGVAPGTDTGEPATDDTAGTDTGEVCEYPLGTNEACLACDDACAASDQCTPDGCLTPSTFGFDQPFAGVGGYPGRLYGFAIDVPNDGWLTQLHFHAVGNGGDVQLALYADGGGVPDQLVAASDVLENYGPGDHDLDVVPTPIGAGTYWVMARNTTPSQIGLDFDPNVPPSFPLTSIFIDFDAPLPVALPATNTFPSFQINLWATVLGT